MNLIGLSGYIDSGKSTVGKIIQYHTRSDKKQYSYEHLEKNGIVYSTEWRIKGFSQKLKKIASLLTGIEEEKFEDQEFKKTLLSEEWNHETTGDRWQVRKFLQLLGTEVIRDRLHENAWVNALFSDYTPIPGKYYYKRTNHSDGWIQHMIDGVEGKGELPTASSLEEMVEKHSKEVAVYPSWIITDVRFENEAQAIKDRGGVIIRVDRKWNKCYCGHTDKCECEPLVDRHISETSLDSWEFDYKIFNDSTIEELIENVRKMLIHYEII